MEENNFLRKKILFVEKGVLKALKGSVQRKLRWVERGVTRCIGLGPWCWTFFCHFI
jgi:hypothetical protein